MIREDWIKVKTRQERAVMIKRTRIARLIIICGYFGMIILFILFVIFPSFGISLKYSNTNITDRSNLMPLEAYYMYNVSYSPFYEITFILQSLGMTVMCATYTSTDTFMALLIFHICGQLENLKTRILDLNKLNDFENTLSSSVQDHIRLIGSIKTIDNTFTLLIFGVLINFGAFFALSGFLFITIITQGRNLPIGQLILNLSSFFAIFMLMCLYCVVGEFLVIHVIKTSGGYISVLLAHRN